MDTPLKKTFAELAQSQKDRELEQATAAKEKAQEQQKHTYLLDTDGVKQARISVEKAIESVQQQVREVGAPYAISTRKYTDAQLEVAIRDRWLLTGNLTERNFRIALFDYKGRRSSDHTKPSPESETSYEMALNEEGQFIWKHRSGSLDAKGVLYTASPDKSTWVLPVEDGLAEFMLKKVLQVAERTATYQ